MLYKNLARLIATKPSRYFVGVEKFFHTSSLRVASFDDGQHGHSKLLYSRLSENRQYQFLDERLTEVEPSCSDLTEKMLHIIRNGEESQKEVDELHAELLTRLQDWAKHSQLRVGYLMHLDQRIHSKEYITRVIKHMGQEDPHRLAPHELVTLLLLVYFRRDSTLEEMVELMDLDGIQVAFASAIQANQLSPEEICAGCLGFKKIKSYITKNIMFRSTLYKCLDCKDVNPEFKDFFLMTIMTTLSKGSFVYNDKEILINQAMESFKKNVDEVSLMTAIKMVGFGLPAGVYNENLSEKVISHVENNWSSLNLKDALSLSNIFSKTRGHLNIASRLNTSLESHFNNATSLSDVLDVLNCQYFLSSRDIYNLELVRLFHDAMCSVQARSLETGNLVVIAKEIADYVISAHPNKVRLLDDLQRSPIDYKAASTLCRIPAYLTISLRLDRLKPNDDDQDKAEDSIDWSFLNLARAGTIMGLFHKKLPMALYSPHINTEELDNRSRLLVNCYRGLVKVLGNETNAAAVRILPHMTEPDIVFGQLGGMCLSVPDYIKDTTLLRPKKPPEGEWRVFVMATRKTMNASQELMGPEQVKVRQLAKLGYIPIVVPYKDLISEAVSQKAILSILKFNNVGGINLDDGYLGKNPRSF